MTLPNEASGRPPRRLGSYTTAKITAGRVERLERHTRRLRRDAARLGLPLPDARAIETLFLESAAEAFGSGDGILRVEWSRLPEGEPELIATPRAYRQSAPFWRAIVARAVHPGPAFRANTKYTDVSAYDLGRDELTSRGVEEALLFDEAGLLVEGSVSNLLLVPGGQGERADRPPAKRSASSIATPALALGGVEGLGLSIVRDDHPDIAEVRVTRNEVRTASELIAVNAVRGAVPIIELDGEPIGTGKPGPWARKLGAIFGP